MDSSIHVLTDSTLIKVLTDSNDLITICQMYIIFNIVTGVFGDIKTEPIKCIQTGSRRIKDP